MGKPGNASPIPEQRLSGTRHVVAYFGVFEKGCMLHLHCAFKAPASQYRCTWTPNIDTHWRDDETGSTGWDLGLEHLSTLTLKTASSHPNVGKSSIDLWGTTLYSLK